MHVSLIALTRKDAETLGKTRYFTGKPCLRGHVEERLRTTRVCVGCARENSRTRYVADPVTFQEASKNWRKANPVAVRQMERKWREENPHIGGVSKARKRSPNSVPAWSDEEACKAIYLEARKLGLEVDHIIPLKGKMVSGLHVAANLQVLTKAANRAKWDTFTPG